MSKWFLCIVCHCGNHWHQHMLQMCCHLQDLLWRSKIMHILFFKSKQNFDRQQLPANEWILPKQHWHCTSMRCGMHTLRKLIDKLYLMQLGLPSDWKSLRLLWKPSNSMFGVFFNLMSDQSFDLLRVCVGLCFWKIRLCQLQFFYRSSSLFGCTSCRMESITEN